jgi:hypothetical protein
MSWPTPVETVTVTIDDINCWRLVRSQFLAASRPRRSTESLGMPEPARPQKITFAEMRDMGVRGILVDCADYHCSHSLALSADRWPDDLAPISLLLGVYTAIPTARKTSVLSAVKVTVMFSDLWVQEITRVLLNLISNGFYQRLESGETREEMKVASSSSSRCSKTSARSTAGPPATSSQPCSANAT